MQSTPTCLSRLGARVVGLPSSRTSSLGSSLPCVRTELQRGVRPPRRCTKPGRGCAGCGTNRWPRGCRESGAEGGRTAGLNAPTSARRPAVPTRRGRGREQPQPVGRVTPARLRGPVRPPAGTPHDVSRPIISGTRGRGWGCRIRRSGAAAPEAAAVGYKAPLVVSAPLHLHLPLPGRHPSWTLMGEGLGECWLGGDRPSKARPTRRS